MTSSVSTSFTLVDWANAGKVSANTAGAATAPMIAYWPNFRSFTTEGLKVCVLIAFKSPAQPYFCERINQ